MDDTHSIQEFLDDDDLHTITNLFVNGKCSECGNCCSNTLPMTIAEVSQIKRYIAEHDIKPTIRTSILNTTRTFDLRCPFLDDQKSCHKCKIYEVRPQICRDFDCGHGEYKPPKAFVSAYKKGKIKNYNVRTTFFG